MKLYHRPFHWWGDCWAKPSSRTLADLVEQLVLTPSQRDWLVAHLRSGGSLVVAAEESRSGKSTLAHALIDAVPPGRERIYVRGSYEPFDWVDSITPGNTTILVNEISPHLPVYSWGPSARRVLELAESGFQVLASMHGERPEQVTADLTSTSVGATAAQVAALDVIVFRNSDLAMGKRFNSVSSIWKLGYDPDHNKITYEQLHV